MIARFYISRRDAYDGSVLIDAAVLLYGADRHFVPFRYTPARRYGLFDAAFKKAGSIADVGIISQCDAVIGIVNVDGVDNSHRNTPDRNYSCYMAPVCLRQNTKNRLPIS